MDALGDALYDTQSELAGYEQDYEEGCSLDPEDCASEEEAAVDLVGIAHGPSATESLGECEDEGEDAILALADAVGETATMIIAYEGAVLAGITLSAAAIAAFLALAFSIGFVAGWYVGVWLACAQAIVPADGVPPSFRLEPVYRN
ncbi:MAG: hypothetical protein AMXMBFR57_37430 [Acidimicrobiia bacterium]